MTAKDLKNALLQEAVQGKLVPQIPSEGNAQDLLDQIKKEKTKLVKEGKLKKEKPLPPITDEEKPFEIPENWCWCRLGEIVYNNGQKKPDKEFSYIDIGSIDNEHQRLNEKEIIIQPEKAPSRARKIVKNGDVIYATVRPYLHNMCIVDKDFKKEPIASTGFAILSCYSQINNKYLFYYLLSPQFDNYANDTDNAKGVAYPAINDDRLYKGLIPIPPSTEQRRIVDILERFIPLIDEYGEKDNELSILNEQIGKKLKSAILQEAVQGKIVPQIASEGNARNLLEEMHIEKAKLIKLGKIKKGKPLPPITEDEIPFDIPGNWCWCRLGEIIQVLSGVSYDKKDVTKIGYRILRGGNIQQMKVLLDKDDIFLPEQYKDEDKLIRKGDILIVASTGSKTVIGKAGYVDRDISDIMIGAFLRICRPYSLDIAGYLRCLFESDFYRKHIRDLAQGTNINNVKESYITEFAIPLPPLAEQKRIVATIEQLLPLFEKLGELNG